MQAAAKVGVFGPQGSGKTFTLFCIALGLSKTFHDGAPIAMQDTENGSDFLVPIAKREGVKLFVRKSRAFADMRVVLAEARKLGACVFLADSISHTWEELKTSYMEKLKVTRLEFHHWNRIKPEWRLWVDDYLNSPLHCLIAGRAGYEYEYQERDDDSGKKELIRGAAKMKAEGEFGYEPSLLFEMETIRGEDDRGRTSRGSFVHLAHVLKDRTLSLNGKTFEFPDANAYKAGDWKRIFESFLPHFKNLSIGQVEHKALESSTSEDLFDEEGRSQWSRNAQAKRIALEEVEQTIVVLWPGQDAKSKRLKALVVERLYGVKAWSAVEAMPLNVVERGLLALRELEVAQRDAQLTDEQEILRLVSECMEKVSGKDYAPSR